LYSLCTNVSVINQEEWANRDMYITWGRTRDSSYKSGWEGAGEETAL